MNVSAANSAPHSGDLLYLAPLRGVTDAIFRTAFERCFGRFDVMVAPFITTVKGKAVTPAHAKDVAGPENDRLRLVPQILGNDPIDLLLLCGHLHALGYHTVNWNLGCPHPQVRKKRRGSGLLPHHDLVRSLLVQIMPRIPCRFSVKVRLGLSDKGDLERLMAVFNEYSLSEVIIHPRTGEQMYSGTVDLDAFGRCAELCRHPVVYNGDIVTAEGFKELRQRFPKINRWMIGRGAGYDPYLPAKIRGIFSGSDLSVLRAFHDEIFNRSRERLSGPGHLLGKMKELWGYFAFTFKNGRNVLKAVQRCSTVDEYCRRVDEAFGKR
jgi:tRNA-dihydrouridine synthase